ncbi:hypothetical protein D3C85_204290 [compost metagenome]
MRIAAEQHQLIRNLDVDEHRTHFAYDYWANEFDDNLYLKSRLKLVRDALGDSFTRSELVSFYKEPKVGDETKFIACMIWGHEAPAGSRRDSRGPWKLSKMFADINIAEEAIRSVSLASEESLIRSYKAIHKALDRCGPNFFSKHFYFLGKSQGMCEYPLIFDDRVASGLLKLTLGSSSVMSMVNIGTIRKPDAYLRYLKFAFEQAHEICCEPDQIEYYLFTL